MRALSLLIPLTALSLLGMGGAQVSIPALPAGLLAGGGGARPTPPEVKMNLDGTWLLAGGTALRPVSGELPSLTFAGDRVSGTGGCNRLIGSVQVGQGTLTFNPLGVTQMLCEPAVNAQETAFLRFLGQRGLRAQMRGDTLTLTDAGGQTLSFRRSATGQGNGTPTATPAVREGTYTLATVNGQAAPQTAEPVTLTLQGGQLSGSDGCNTFSAPYRLEGNRLMLTGEPASTLRACPDLPQTVNVPALLAARPILNSTATGLTLQADGTTLTFTRN